MNLGLASDTLLSTTRAVRHRLDLTRPVPRAVLEECVDLAVQAPTGRNRQRWHFVIVTDPASRAVLADLWRASPGVPDAHQPLPARDMLRAEVVPGVMKRVYTGVEHL
ncbi:nitroreductase family protein [Streptomyces sp. NPDC102409]|uniref:nitroreductase family protein n=1 Tax=Streptomyces sp. NPDC102409 TaxID=3366172 RepID=UPI0037F58551